MSVPKTAPAGVLTSQHVAMAFGTPVTTYLWPDSEQLNSTLRGVILAREQATPSAARSNAGGWQSGPDLLRWQAPEIEVLKRRISTLALDFIRLTSGAQAMDRVALRMDAWANVCRRGHYHQVHDHPSSAWSGVYYVDGGRPDHPDPVAGKLELLDPRVGVSMVFHEKSALFGRLLIEPIPGLMILFPSWVKHMVHPFNGDSERISIAFNVVAEVGTGAQ